MEDKIKADLKEAMLARNETAVGTLRLLLSELTYAKVQKGERDSTLPDSEVISVVQKELKKRKEGAAGFRSGNREDEALKEEAEAKVLENYLPTQLSDEELTKIIEEAITKVGASSLADMGKVIGLVMGQVGQGADGGRVSALVKVKLNQ